MLPALLAASTLGFGLAVYAHLLRRTGLRIFGIALGVTAAAAAWSFRRQTIQMGVLEIPAYGTALGVALIAGWWLTVKLARQEPKLAGVQDALIVAGVCGLLVGRASYVLISAKRLPDLEILALRQGGLLGMGALLGGLLGTYVFLRRFKLDFWAWLDTVGPAFALGVVLVRVGCYLNGCDYGTRLYEGAPGWLLTLGRFERWSSSSEGLIEGPAAWIDQVVSGAITPDQPFAQPVHPAQLYEAVGALLLLLLAYFMRRREAPRGQVGLAIVFAYSALRFVVEVWRGDEGRGQLGPHLHPTVLLSIGLLLFAAAFAYGPAASVERGPRRMAALGVSLVPAGLGALLVSRSAQAIQPSISQWLALLTAGWAAYCWTLTIPRKATTSGDSS